ncbi:ROK family protein [Fuscibacter oryzae]|uniref:N-acetylglucosamine kinase n=1 Tax=Fuscibacter oryzae TaxID=2803939 RepID=A0A8J7MRW4_9RHOB|nr:ROK family protein [Fuscibacter oryzae]MBL4929178.1 ROK family protein [Fuscibacter oryzae]
MILAFEIGGSRIRAARVQGAVLEPLGECPTPADDLSAFVAALRGFLTDETVVSLSIAGVVDPISGRIIVANIPCLNGRAVAADLTAALGRPVTVLNDADCFALAEARHGAGRGHASVFALILGTGVGGGLVMNGRLVSGPGGIAGEWGHGPVVRGAYALPCGCGQVGCLDQLGGARGLERLHRLIHGHDLSAPEIVTNWRNGDASALASITEWRAILGGPLAMLVNTLGVTCLPVGGGLSNAPDLIAALDETVRAGILRATDAPLLVPAQLGADAGLIGAAEAGAG